jgi:hypothetical protein
MKRRTVLSMEQALSLPYATLRFAQLGWRVIRIESTPAATACRATPTATSAARWSDDDRRSYFIAPNVGKEAIALNLKDPQGQALLRAARRARRRRLLLQHRAAPLPAARHRLRDAAAAKPDLIWAGISAMGPDVPRRPRLRPGDPGHGRLHGADRPGRRPADALRRAAGRPQGRRRGLRQRHAGAGRARRDRPRHAHRRLHAAGGRLLAHHHPAAARLRLPARTRSPAAATSTASSSRPTSTRRATASSTWPSAATCSGSA